MSKQQLAVIQPARRPAVAQRTEATRTINEFQLDTAEIDTRPEPLAARFVLWALGLLVLSAVVWATIAHIDRIVTARGKIISTAPNVVLQPLEVVAIRGLHAKVGDIVKAGTVLATLDPTFTQADLGQIEARIASLDAFIARLESEQASRSYSTTATSPSDYGLLQLAIWRERRTQYEAQMRVYNERIGRTQANIVSREREREYLASRLKIMREVEGMRAELEAAKTGSRLNSLAARDTRIEIERSLSNTENALIESRHEQESIEAEREVFKRQWDGKIVEDLVAKRNERDGLAEQLIKAQRRQQMVELSSPVDAVVLEVAPRSVGSVIREAEALFKLVPLNAPLEIEAMIDARQLGYVVVGDAVQVKLDAYPYQEHGMIDGKVLSISGDSFTNENQNASDTPTGAFYKARIALDKVDLRNVPDSFQLIPGMPLNAEIKVGTRSVISYFLRPLLRGVNESMREP